MSKNLQQILLLGSFINGQYHMKRCSTSLVITEMQIKTRIKYCFTSTRMARIKKADKNKHWQEYGEIGSLIRCG